MFTFLGIGAQKAGTTWLYTQLNSHPRIGFPKGKELHFWNRLDDPERISAYLGYFSDPQLRQGEITPAYALLPVSVISQIRHVAPELRLLYIIRNPVERAWSSALMALGRAEMTLEEASDQWFIDHFHSAGSLARGDYETCLRNWRAVFPDEQLLVLRFEQIVSEPEALLSRCFRHLGVAPRSPEQLPGCRTPVFGSGGQRLRPSLKPVLHQLYRERIDALADYLNTDLQAWRDG